MPAESAIMLRWIEAQTILNDLEVCVGLGGCQAKIRRNRMRSVALVARDIGASLFNDSFCIAWLRLRLICSAISSLTKATRRAWNLTPN